MSYVRPIRHFLVRRAFVAAWMGVCVSANAQTRPSLSTLLGKDTIEGVYVRDSAVVVEKLSLAERLARLGEWEKASDVYQEILTGYPDRVVPSALDERNRIYQYSSVGDTVQQRLADWPVEGLSAFRARFEIDASTLLETAQGDEQEVLQRVLSTYFVTDTSRTAALRLVDRSIQSGEFAPAVWMCDRMLATHPSLGETRPLFLYRAGIAEHLLGDAPAAERRAATLKKEFPQAIGQVGGKDVVLADTLAREIASTAAPVAATASESWRMAFGSPDRSAIPKSSTYGGACLVSIKLPEPEFRGLAEDTRKELTKAIKENRDAGLTAGILPAVDRGELFFQDDARIYAVGLQSGQPLPGWAQTYNNPRLAPYSIAAFPSPRGQVNAVALTDESVLAVMGQPDARMMGAGVFTEKDTRLVCLDRANGRERWVIQPKKLPDNTGPARALDLVGSPLVVGHRVFVLGRGGNGMQFEDAYVLCFDLSTGSFLWSSYLASAPAMSPMIDLDAGTLRSTGAAHLAYSSGRIYALTSLGVLASIDAFTGSAVWIDIYPRISTSGQNGLVFGRARGNIVVDDRAVSQSPLSVNPVIVSNGKVFVLPSDARHLLVYDAGTGQEIKRISTASYDDCSTLLGVVGDRLVLGSKDSIYCIEWKKYSADAPKDAIRWKSPSNSPSRKDSTAANQIIGRGFVTSEHVFVTIASKLRRINLENGKVEAIYPTDDRSWPKKEGPGNITIAQNHLIIAGSDQVAVYTDLDDAKSRLDAVIAANPTDPEPRISYAEICFAGDQTAVALMKLDEAIDLIGGRAAMTAGRMRDRVFQTSLSFAEQLNSRSKRPQDAETIVGLYDRAAAAASTSSQQVSSRFSRAAYLEGKSDVQQQVALYQAVITDPQWRESTTSRDVGGTPRRERAGDVARDAIARLIVANGMTVYADSYLR